MRQPFAVPVAKDLMTREVVTAKPDDLVESAAKVFAEKGFDHLPVVDEENKLVGIVTSWNIAVAVGRGKNYSEREKREIIDSTMVKIGMNPDEILGRFPHQTSGGQMQRLLVARALIMDPDVLIADEPTSQIDASTRVAVLNELLRLKKEGLSVLFITHDVAQAFYISDRAGVMGKGEVVEEGPVEEVFFNPKHPYTKDLISNVPPLHKKWKI